MSSGHIIILTSKDQLAVARPDGSHPSVLTYLGRFAQGFPTVSPDRRFLARADGTIVSLTLARPAFVTTQLHLDAGHVLSNIEPFADHDLAVVDIGLGQFGGATASADVNVITLSSGSVTPVGIASRAAGDPQQPGVFAVVPGPEVGASSASQVEPPDASVELRDSASPPVSLISATTAAAAVGFDRTTPVVLYPWPDPRGDKVAITVVPSDGSSTEGVVVVDRTGTLKGEILASVGPVAGARASWSPDGSTIAYVGVGPNGSEIATWTLAGAVSVRDTPVGEPGAGLCIWSPDGSSLLCPAVANTQFAMQWYLAGALSGPVSLVHGSGLPLGWISDPQSSGGQP